MPALSETLGAVRTTLGNANTMLNSLNDSIIPIKTTLDGV